MQQPRTVFYHHPCLDGSTAAWAAYKKFGDECRYVGLDHADYATIEEKILTDVTPDTIATFVDFAPRIRVFENILNHVKAVEIFDHHISAQKDLTGFSGHPKCRIFFDMNRSGAGIAYDVFSGGKARPLFVDLVERLDLYRPQTFDSEEQFYRVSAYLSSLDVDKPLPVLLPLFDELSAVNDISWFEERGDAPRAGFREKITNVMAHMDFVNLGWLDHGQGCENVPAVKAHINEMGHEFSPLLLNACPHMNKIGMVWEFHDDDTIKLSLRSDGNVDVSQIAEEIGREHGLNGGGHKGASAVRLTRAQFHDFARKINLPFNDLKKGV